MYAHTHTRPHERIKVLFLCTGNSCRSQMAEGWGRHLHGDILEAYSAGTAPHGLDPMAVKVMAEAGVDIAAQTSNHMDEYLEVPFDLIVTVCDSARESCPFFPGGGKVVHRSFPDPPVLARNADDSEDAAVFYRQVRDAIRDFVEQIPDMIDLDQGNGSKK